MSPARGALRAATPDRRRPARCRTARAPARAPSKARLQRSAQRSESRMARSISARVAGSFDAFVELHHDVGAEQVLDLDRRAPASAATIAPSRCERKVTPFSSSLRSCDSDITWKPPESVRIGCGQFMNVCRPPSARDALGARPQHQVIGVAEHDVGADRAHVRRDARP